jgi:hypothetical protein
LNSRTASTTLRKSEIAYHYYRSLALGEPARVRAAAIDAAHAVPDPLARKAPRGGVDLDVDMVVDLDGDGNVEVAESRGRRRPIRLTC